MRKPRQTAVELLALGHIAGEGWSLGSGWGGGSGAAFLASGFPGIVHVTMPVSLLGQDPGSYMWLREWPPDSDVCV